MNKFEVADNRTDIPIFIHSALDDYGLTPVEFRVYARIARRAGPGTAYESVPNMAKAFGVSDKTVQRCLRVLVLCNLLECESREGKSTQYKLTSSGSWRDRVDLTVIRESVFGKAGTKKAPTIPELKGRSTYEAKRYEYMDALAAQQGGMFCHYCRCVLEPMSLCVPTSASLDHKVPASKGGSHAISNLVLSCRSCNSQKNDHVSYEDFYERTRRFREGDTTTPGPSVATPVSSVAEIATPQTDEGSPSEGSPESESVSARAEKLLTFYSKTVKPIDSLHYKTRKSWLTLIEVRLREEWSDAQLAKAFKGCSLDDWKDRWKWNGVDHILKDRDSIERFIEFTERKGGKRVSQPQRIETPEEKDRRLAAIAARNQRTA